MSALGWCDIPENYEVTSSVGKKINPKGIITEHHCHM